VNGQRANNTNGSLGLTLKLGPGDNILEIKAVDSAGNAAYANRTVVLDQTPPPLTITEPASGLRTSEGSITLRGATDPWCTVSINGEAVTVDRKGKFAKELSLDEGDNTLVVTSVDMGGNPTTRLVRVVRTGALSMGGSEAPVLLAGLTIGVVVGVAAGFLAAARLRRRRADIAAPEEPVPGGYDIPEEPRAPGQAVQKHVHHARDPADQKMALPSVPEPEPLDDAAAGRAAGEKRKGAGGGRRA
jgi:hypothetical protein